MSMSLLSFFSSGFIRMGSSVTAGLSTAAMVGTVVIVGGTTGAVTMGHPAAAEPACSDTATEATAAETLAKSCQRRVEDLSLRTDSSQTFANADGTLVTELSATPQRVYRSDGIWAAIDPTLRADGNGSIEPVTSTMDVRFSSGGTDPLVTVANGQRQFTMSWPATLPAPSLSGDTATYSEVMPGVDLVVRATGSGFTHVVVVKDATAAANPALLAISYPLGGTGVTIEEREQGGFSVVADDGSVVLESGDAAMWDSSTGADEALPSTSEQSTSEQSGMDADLGQVATDLDNGALVIEPDSLSLSQATYPLYIDPQWMDPTTSSRWAYANSANEENDTTWARVGKDPDSGAIYRPLFEFSTSGLIGARIISASFKITLYHSYSCADSPTPVRLWRMATIASTPRTSWSSASLIQDLDTQSASANKGSCAVADTPDMNFSGTLGTDLQNIVNGGATTYTVGLSTATSTSGTGESTASWWKKFYASSARLIVYYNKAPKTPAATDMSIVPSFTCGLTSIRVNGLNGITLRANLSDADGDNIAAQWQVTGIDASYAPADSAPAAGGVFKVSIPAAALTDGSSYSWTVRGTDGTDAGAYGPDCAFEIDNSLPGDPVASSDELAMVSEEPAPAPLASAIVGQASTVTLQPAPGDTAIAGYVIGVGSGAPAAPAVWIPAKGDGTASASVVPVASGDTVNYLTIAARNRTGQTGGVVTYVFQANAPSAESPHVAGDATGDGRADVTAMSDMGDGQSALWRWNATASGSLAHAIAPQDATGIYATASTKIAQGDFDGDGLADVATFAQVGSDVVLSVQRSNANALLGTQVKTLTGWSLSSVNAVVANFDADSQQRDDLAIFYDEGGYVFTVRMLMASGTLGSPAFDDPVIWWTQPASGGISIANMKIYSGDFDGDGREDVGFFYQYSNCQTKMWVQYSTGTAFGNETMVWDSGANIWCWANSQLGVGDFDADGHADVAVFYYYGGCDTRIWMFYGADNQTIESPFVTWASGAGQWCDSDNETYVGDVTGDGKADLAVVLRCCGVYQTKISTFASTGRGFDSPVFQWEGALGPISAGSLTLEPTTRYQIVNLGSGKCLAVMGGDGTQLSQQTCTTGDNMTFTFDRGVTPHLMRIHPVQSPNSCVEIKDLSLASTAPVQQAACTGQTNQRYQITYLSGFTDPLVTITSEVSGMNIDLPYGNDADGVLIWQYTQNDGTSQKFYLRVVV